jgi:hypothetical protein
VPCSCTKLTDEKKRERKKEDREWREEPSQTGLPKGCLSQSQKEIVEILHVVVIVHLDIANPAFDELPYRISSHMREERNK